MQVSRHWTFEDYRGDTIFRMVSKFISMSSPARQGSHLSQSVCIGSFRLGCSQLMSPRGKLGGNLFSLQFVTLEAGWSHHRLRQVEICQGPSQWTFGPVASRLGSEARLLYFPRLRRSSRGLSHFRLRSSLRRRRREKCAGGHGTAVSTRGRYNTRFRFIPLSSLVFAWR